MVIGVVRYSVCDNQPQDKCIDDIYLYSRISVLLFLKDMAKRRIKRTRIKSKTRRTMKRSGTMRILLNIPRKKVLPKRPRWKKKDPTMIQPLIKHPQWHNYYLLLPHCTYFEIRPDRSALHHYHPYTLASNEYYYHISHRVECLAYKERSILRTTMAI